MFFYSPDKKETILQRFNALTQTKYLFNNKVIELNDVEHIDNKIECESTRFVAHTISSNDHETTLITSKHTKNVNEIFNTGTATIGIVTDFIADFETDSNDCRSIVHITFWVHEKLYTNALFGKKTQAKIRDFYANIGDLVIVYYLPENPCDAAFEGFIKYSEEDIATFNRSHIVVLESTAKSPPEYNLFAVIFAGLYFSFSIVIIPKKYILFYIIGIPMGIWLYFIFKKLLSYSQSTIIQGTAIHNIKQINYNHYYHCIIELSNNGNRIRIDSDTYIPYGTKYSVLCNHKDEWLVCEKNLPEIETCTNSLEEILEKYKNYEGEKSINRIPNESVEVLMQTNKLFSAKEFRETKKKIFSFQAIKYFFFSFISYVILDYFDPDLSLGLAGAFFFGLIGLYKQVYYNVTSDFLHPFNQKKKLDKNAIVTVGVVFSEYDIQQQILQTYVVYESASHDIYKANISNVNLKKTNNSTHYVLVKYDKIFNSIFAIY